MERFFGDRSDADPVVDVWDALYRDMTYYEDLLQKEDNHFARRAYFRGAFAFVEGTIHFLRESLLRRIQNNQLLGDLVNFDHVSLLVGQSAILDDTGRIKHENQRIPTAKVIAFVMRMHAETLEYDPCLLFSDNGWESLRKSMKVRDRVTHPKAIEDLLISDAEMDLLRLGLAWYLKAYAAPMEIEDILNEDNQGKRDLDCSRGT
jgi:hypothetical protein